MRQQKSNTLKTHFPNKKSRLTEPKQIQQELNPKVRKFPKNSTTKSDNQNLNKHYLHNQKKKNSKQINKNPPQDLLHIKSKAKMINQRKKKVSS